MLKELDFSHFYIVLLVVMRVQQYVVKHWMYWFWLKCLANIEWFLKDKQRMNHNDIYSTQAVYPIDFDIDFSSNITNRLKGFGFDLKF